MIAYFNGELISPLIMLFSPLLNMAFALAMPFLFVLAYPFWSWQLDLGLSILKVLQKLVEVSAHSSSYVPFWEINVVTLLCFGLFYFGKKKSLSLVVLFLSFSLNLDLAKNPSFGPYDFVPQGKVLKIVSNEMGEIVYWSDGKCKRELVRGLWWEKCSPKRKRSTRKNKFKKLSSASREHRTSSLRGSRT